MPTDFLPLQTPLKADAIRTVNFFNGRLLTARTMDREQQARREADARIGLAMGDGIAAGLEVAFAGDTAPGGRPAATVEPGTAVNRTGHVLRLPQRITLALAEAPAPAADNVTCLFGDCGPLATGDYVSGQGLYLLTIGPAFTTEGRAEVSGMGDTAVRCATDATVEAVQFRLLLIRPELFGSANPASADFRNRIAYHAFGLGVRKGWPADLRGSDPRGDDLIEIMRDHGLTDAEVPLALVAFANNGHRFTDCWSVRRPVFTRDEGSVFAGLAEPRRIGVGRAMFRQFQDELDDLAAPASVVASTRFGFLPPAGFLPGFTEANAANFFGVMTVRGPTHIDGSAVEPLLRESFSAPAIATDSNHVLWLYRIAQTAMADEAPILMFASGHLPYRADARFNLNHFNYANYALIP
jgi:hypothetical protein